MPGTSCTGEYCPYYEDQPTAVPYSVSVQQLSRHVWVFRGHPKEGGVYGDPWLDVCVLRAERFVGDSDLATEDTDEPRPVAHLLAMVTNGNYPVAAHRGIGAVLLAMGFTERYHERLRSGRLVRRVVKLRHVPAGHNTVSETFASP